MPPRDGKHVTLALIGAIVSGCHPRPPELGRGGCPRNEAKEFRERYPNPVVEDRQRTVIPGVDQWTVWEGSHAAEDPIATEEWLVLPGGLRFLRDEGGVHAALCHTGWGPRSAHQALRVATLAFAGDDGTVIEEGAELPETIPAQVRGRVKPPRVSATGAGYRVELDVHHLDSTARHYGEHIESVERCTATMRAGQLEAQCKELFSVVGNDRE